PETKRLQCPGLRRLNDGLSCRHSWRTNPPAGRDLDLRKPGRLPLHQLAPYLLPLPQKPAPYLWPEVFHNDQLVEIEIGFGKGLFLLGAAQANPTTNFVGVENARKYQLLAAARMAKRGLTNVRLANADARVFLRDFVGAESCQAVHLYFPDPWWKRRHLKRR